MKKRFKRLGAMLLAGTMLLGATACGGGSWIVNTFSDKFF